MAGDEGSVFQNHHPAPSGMKRVNSYWKEPHEATSTDNYWKDDSTAHGKHAKTESSKPSHHPAPEGIKRIDSSSGMKRVDSSYWQEPKNQNTSSDNYWNDPAAAHEYTVTRIEEAHQIPHHHPAQANVIPRVNSYWTESKNETTPSDNYWNDPQTAHGKHMVASKVSEEKLPHHHEASSENAPMTRINSYWNDTKNEPTAADGYWMDVPESHGLIEDDMQDEGDGGITI